MERSKRQKGKGNTRAILVFFLCLTMVFISSCGVPTQKPVLVITAPQPGVPAGNITISVDVNNFALLDQTAGPNTIGQGHILYYLDASVPTYYAHSAFSKAGTYAIGFEKSFTWSNVSPGRHTFAAQLVNNDNTPLPAPVTATVILDVAGPQGQPEIVFIAPAAGSSLSPGNIAISLQVNNFIINSQSFGVVNLDGEGHLIYYLDETPPTDPGIPALTDASIVSAELKHLWKNVRLGDHTFYVQLVNNDDTPLAKPVVASISITVAAGG